MSCLCLCVYFLVPLGRRAGTPPARNGRRLPTSRAPGWVPVAGEGGRPVVACVVVVRCLVPPASTL